MDEAAARVRKGRQSGMSTAALTRALVQEHGLDAYGARLVIDRVDEQLAQGGEDLPPPRAGSPPAAPPLPAEETAAAPVASHGTPAVWGFLLIGLGLAITVITFATASPGGVYIVAFGPVIAGIRLLVRGTRD